VRRYLQPRRRRDRETFVPLDHDAGQRAEADFGEICISWRHLDSCQFKTILCARIPRVNCPEHGVSNVAVPWAVKISRFTILVEQFAIEVLLATKAVDLVRRCEHRRLHKEGDDRLKAAKYVWLTSQDNLTEWQEQKLVATSLVELETGKAWGYKEILRDLWHYDMAVEATAFFRDWYRREIRTNPQKKVARTIKER
jgi:hypothetical protein